MAFQGILFESEAAGLDLETASAPDFFGDLNLDQVIEAITAGKQEYRLKPFFYSPLVFLDTIQYRQQVMKDVETKTVWAGIQDFAQKMILMRRYLTLIEGLSYPRHIQGWHLEAALKYCEAVEGLAESLQRADLGSRGLLAFRDFLTGYTNSVRFRELATETKRIKAALSSLKYSVIIRGSRVLVRKYEDEIDYSQDVEQTFEKFKQDAVKDYLSKLGRAAGMNHVEAQILECVARMYPEIFAELENYYQKHAHFQDQTITTFDREIQFYVAYLEHLARFNGRGLPFCYPEINDAGKDIFAVDSFDLALAGKGMAPPRRRWQNAPAAPQEVSPESGAIVLNDFHLQGKERIFVVTGPNQGGKTTFARMFGQLHYLASLGCPVPGRKARLFLSDQIFTHFEREENLENLRGKLQDDLVRILDILNRATPTSIIIMNEIFTSTTLEDAVFLSKEILERAIKLDLLAVFVTFIDELAALSEKTVSMVSMAVPENPAQRTFKIIRRPADGLAYAISIAEKYRLTYADLMERIEE